VVHIEFKGLDFDKDKVGLDFCGVIKISGDRKAKK